MKAKSTKTIMEDINEKRFKVVRVTTTEFELESGDVYPHTLEIDGDISVEEFQRLLDQSKETMVDHLSKIIKEQEKL